ncbi:dihydroorotase [Calditrichota bacterium GD2]
MRNVNIIRNVFIPIGNNELQLVDIHFDGTIQSIEKRLPESVAWSEIAAPEQRASFIQKVSGRLEAVQAPEIDGQFLVLMPGAIDPHVHFNTPGFEFREDFDHASLAALWGGVTTIIDMPCTSLPPVTSLPNMRRKLQALQNRAYCDYAFWGGISGTDFSDRQRLKQNMKELVEAGVMGFKAYLISGMEKFTDLNAGQMKEAAEWIKELNVPLAVHAEDKELVVTRRGQFQAQGQNDWQAYCSARDIEAEARAVSLMASITRQTGAAVHIVHLSSKRGLEIVQNARNNDLPMTAETCPHYLYFTQQDFKRPQIRNYLKTAPPVKFAEDRDALWQGLADGSLLFVTTDHAGCDPKTEKASENFWQVYGGIPGVEHRVPFLLSEGFLKGRLTLEQCVNLLSTNVAHFFKLKNKGSLARGKDADFALIDLWHGWTVKADAMHSKGKYTPFEGVEFKAQVIKTFLRGVLAVNRNENYQTTTPIGKFVPRN